MKAVILAAGYGKRLLPYTQTLPKPLITLMDRPLLEHVISALKESGLDDIAIVTGYLAQAIQSRIGNGGRLGVRIRYVHNSLYQYGNGFSLKAVESQIKDETFMLLMADHLISGGIVKKALRNLRNQPLLCVDKSPLLHDRYKEATKVLVDSYGYVKDIGKKIKRWNGLDTGVFILNKEIFDVIKNLKAYPLELHHCIKELIKKKFLWACDVSGEDWIDIDTWKDIELARSRLSGGAHK